MRSKTTSINVAFIFLHPFSGSLGSTVRVKELAINLRKFNVASYILTPYERNQILAEGVSVVSVAGTMQKRGLGLFFYNLTKFAYYNPFFVKYLMTNTVIQKIFAKKSAASIVEALKRFPVDVLQVEQDFALPTAIQVKKQTGLPLILDLHNITSEELVASNTIIRKSRAFNKLQDMLRKNLNETDKVIVVSELMKDYVVEKYALSSEKVVVVPPGANFVEYSPRSSSGRLKVVYSGLVAYREHVDLFVKSMPFIEKSIPDVDFYITDKGEGLKKIKILAKELNVSPTFFWYPEKQDFMNFISSCDIAVLPSSNDLARQMGTPVKLFDYLSVGLPIVANDIAAWTEIIRTEQIGILTNDTPESFAEGVIRLSNNDLEKYHRRCIHITREKYSWSMSAKSLYQVYTAIFHERCSNLKVSDK